MLERGALDRWGKGDPDGFLELYAADITYFDPVTARRIDGHQAMANYYRPWVGKIEIARYEMLNPPLPLANGFSTKGTTTRNSEIRNRIRGLTKRWSRRGHWPC